MYVIVFLYVKRITYLWGLFLRTIFKSGHFFIQLIDLVVKGLNPHIHVVELLLEILILPIRREDPGSLHLFTQLLAFLHQCFTVRFVRGAFGPDLSEPFLLLPDRRACGRLCSGLFVGLAGLDVLGSLYFLVRRMRQQGPLLRQVLRRSMVIVFMSRMSFLSILNVPSLL